MNGKKSHLEIFSRHQVIIENSRQYLLLKPNSPVNMHQLLDNLPTLHISKQRTVLTRNKVAFSYGACTHLFHDLASRIIFYSLDLGALAQASLKD